MPVVSASRIAPTLYATLILVKRAVFGTCLARAATCNPGVGWELVHVAVDDHSRIAFAKDMGKERKRCAVAFLNAAVAYYGGLGVTVERVMPDNGSCYKSFALSSACKRLGLRHIRTRSYRPQTNGKAERFI
jgi:transposase InsO family protein